MTIFSASTSDDGIETSDGTVTLGDESTDVSGGAGYIAFRFTGVTVPKGSTITSAAVTIYGMDADEDRIRIHIYGEDADNSAALAASDNNISNRTATSAEVAWSSNNAGAPKLDDTPDLSAVVEEIVNRPGWASGNALTIVFSVDTGNDIQDYIFAMADHPTLAAPSIQIDYDDSMVLGYLELFVVDYMGMDTANAREVQWDRLVSDGMGISDNVRIGLVHSLVVVDNMGLDGVASTPLDEFTDGTLLEQSTFDVVGISDNVVIGFGYREIFVQDKLGIGTSAGTPTSPPPSANWQATLSCDIVFGAAMTENQSHTSGDSTVKFLAGYRYRR